MLDVARQLHFTRSLAHFSERLDELLERARLHQSQLPPELIDEIAFTTGELVLVMTNYPGDREDDLVREVLSHAKSLRERIRADRIQGDEVTQEYDNFRREIARLVTDSKKAA